MSFDQFFIAPFSNIPGVAEIIGLGEVRLGRGKAIEAEIKVLLAGSLEDPEFDETRDVVTRWVACGQLRFLTSGSRWRAGHYIGNRPIQSFIATVRALDTRSWNIRTLGSEEPGGDGDWRTLPSEEISAAPCFGLQFSEVSQNEGEPPRIGILPYTELARALFGVSSRLMNEAIDGLRNPEASNDRGIMKRQSCHLDVPDEVFLWCYVRPKRREAEICAAIISDPRMRASHDGIFQHLSISNEWGNSRATWMSVGWPFSEPVRWQVEGRWMKRREENGRRFLITKITAMTIPFKFKSVVVSYPGRRKRGKPAGPPTTKKIRVSPARLARLTTGLPASRAIPTSTLTIVELGMGDGNEVSVNFIPRQGHGDGPGTALVGDPREIANLSTADRTDGADPETGRVVIHSEEMRRKLEEEKEKAAAEAARTRIEALEQTWQALLLCEEDEGWEVHPLSRWRNVAHPNGGFDFGKEMLLAKILVGDGFVVVVDSGSVREGTKTNGMRSLGILIPDSNDDLTDGDEMRIRAAELAHKGKWRSDKAAVKGFNVVALKRPLAVWSDSEAYANLLARKIESIFSDGSNGA